jgi:prepilin-type processing-associated H-X9-DG protein
MVIIGRAERVYKDDGGGKLYCEMTIHDSAAQDQVLQKRGMISLGFPPPAPVPVTFSTFMEFGKAVIQALEDAGIQVDQDQEKKFEGQRHLFTYKLNDNPLTLGYVTEHEWVCPFTFLKGGGLRAEDEAKFKEKIAELVASVVKDCPSKKVIAPYVWADGHVRNPGVYHGYVSMTYISESS